MGSNTVSSTIKMDKLTGSEGDLLNLSSRKELGVHLLLGRLGLLLLFPGLGFLLLRELDVSPELRYSARDRLTSCLFFPAWACCCWTCWTYFWTFEDLFLFFIPKV